MSMPRMATVSLEWRGMAGLLAWVSPPLDAGVLRGAPPVHPIRRPRLRGPIAMQKLPQLLVRKWERRAVMDTPSATRAWPACFGRSLQTDPSLFRLRRLDPMPGVRSSALNAETLAERKVQD